jgi:Holliday junction resolvase
VKTPESFEKAEICRYLDSIGAWYFKPMMNGFGKSGVPDIVACVEGRFIGIEVKREGKLPTAIQKCRMNEIGQSSGTAFWGTAEKVIRELKQWRHSLKQELLKFPWERT